MKTSCAIIFQKWLKFVPLLPKHRLSATELAQLHQQAFTKERPWSALEFKNLIAQPGVFLTCSSHCFALGRLVVDEVEILTVACAPSHQRQGLARQIIVQLLDEATSHGSVWSFLEVASDNTAAISVYQGLEFEEVGQRKNYYKRKDTAPCDALIFRKYLI